MEKKKRKHILSNLDRLSLKEMQGCLQQTFDYIDWIENRTDRQESYLQAFDWNWYLTLHRIQKLLERSGHRGEADEIARFKEYWTGLLSGEDWEKIREETGDDFLGRVVSAYGGPFREDVEYEPTEFDVILESYGVHKIHAVKEFRALSGLGIREAKDIVDAAPHILFEAVSKWKAEEVKEKMEGVGAIIKVVPTEY